MHLDDLIWSIFCFLGIFGFERAMQTTYKAPSKVKKIFFLVKRVFLGFNWSNLIQIDDFLNICDTQPRTRTYRGVQ